MSNTKRTEEEVLLDFAIEPVHDSEVLAKYIKTYPQFAVALADCLLELRIELPSDFKPVADASAADRAWNSFRELTVGFDDVSDPFERLGSAAFRALASEMDINSLFLMRVRDRVIEAATIPVGFIELLADRLRVSSAVLSKYLRLSPSLGTGVQFKSSNKPEAPKQIDFVDAVGNSGLTQEQQENLLNLKD